MASVHVNSPRGSRTHSFSRTNSFPSFLSFFFSITPFLPLSLPFNPPFFPFDFLSYLLLTITRSTFRPPLSYFRLPLIIRLNSLPPKITAHCSNCFNVCTMFQIDLTKVPSVIYYYYYLKTQRVIGTVGEMLVLIKGGLLTF